MATIPSFRDLEVWNMAMDIVLDCYQISDRYPKHERYGLIAETRKSARSIPSNVAEGHNRHAPKAYLNHVNIALGSQAELDTQIETAIRLQGDPPSVRGARGIGDVPRGAESCRQDASRPAT